MAKQRTNQNQRSASSRAKTSSENENGNEQQMDNDLHKLFLDELGDIYNAEQQLTKALPKMVKAARTSELQEAFQGHLDETRKQVTRLEQVAKSVEEKLEPHTCEAMKGLIEEAEELMEDNEDSSALDAALIAAAQKVEHYEIATYGTLIAWARQMGHDEAVDLLEETLQEEKAADEKLMSISESANQEGQREQTRSK